MANRFNGSYRGAPKLHNNGRASWGPRGIKADVQADKHAEALERNRQTPHVRTKTHRVRCSMFGANACTVAPV